MSRISHLILDFDDTLTTTDTISLLAKAAYTLSPQLSPPWSHFVDAYISDYNRHALSHPKSSRLTLADEVSYLASLHPVERVSIQRIEAAGVFKGLHTTNIAKAAASTVPLRPGFWDLCRPILNSGGAIDILSVNWSRAWIQSSLRNAVLPEERERFDADVGIYCNDLVYDPDGVTTGKISCEFVGGEDGIWTAAHKVKMMEHLVAKRGGEGQVMYVGDSSTDLMCLLKADVGVVIGDKLDEVCERISVKLDYGLNDYKDANCGGQLYKVQDLEELRSWIEGRNCTL
ncbi:HAD-like domain-containing protein [Trichophaea hybrida]|nr:HAD-like domain-containing protein [Trichophaea hybrida]